MDLTFHRLGQQDLRTVLDYYHTVGGAVLADRFFAELTTLVARVASHPTSFHSVGEGLRRANLTSFPYHILFHERPGAVRVLVLRHHRRHPAAGIRRS